MKVNNKYERKERGKMRNHFLKGVLIIFYGTVPNSEAVLIMSLCLKLRIVN